MLLSADGLIRPSRCCPTLRVASGGFAGYHAPVMSRLPIITLLSTPVKLNSKCAHYLSGRID